MRDFKGSLRLLVLAAVLGMGGVAAVAVTPSGPATASPSGPIAGAGIVSFGGHLSQIANPGIYSTAIANASDASTLAGLPGRSLAYFSGADVNVNWSTGVPYTQALANGWLLAGSTGSLLTNRGYAGNYVGDVGSSAYQRAWITNVLAYLAAHPGVDGVFIDDVLYDLKPLAGTEAAKYPTQQQWAAAMASFVAAVGNALRSHGYYVALNASGYVPGDSSSSDGTNTVNWWRQLGPYVNGLMNEYYDETSNGTNQLRTMGTAWYQQWDGWQRLIGTAQAMGDDFFGLLYSRASDTAAMQYGKASFLLEWNGGGGAFMYHTTDNSDPTSSAWTTDIGRPTGLKQQVGVGWKRTYTGGLALVNPSPTSSQTFSLGGGYVTPAGATVTSVTLQPATGMVLTGNAPATTTRATTTTTTTTRTTTTGTTTNPHGHKKPRPKNTLPIGVTTSLDGYREVRDGFRAARAGARRTRVRHHGSRAGGPVRRPQLLYRSGPLRPTG